MHYPKTMLFRVQVVPGVLKCRRRSCKLPQHGLDQRIARYITKAGFEGLFKVPNLEVDYALQDIEVMLGVRVDGLPKTGVVKMD